MTTKITRRKLFGLMALAPVAMAAEKAVAQSVVGPPAVPSFLGKGEFRIPVNPATREWMREVIMRINGELGGRRHDAGGGDR